MSGSSFDSPPRIARQALVVFPLLFACLCLPPPARALMSDGGYPAALAAERPRAGLAVREAAALADRLRNESAGRVAAAESEAAAARSELAVLQKDLLSALTKDDTPAADAVRARLATRQDEAAAAESEKNLLQRRLEEADRDVDAWRKRLATLDLALRADIQAMLAGADEMADREKRPDAAAKDIQSQSGQIRKYVSRQENACLAAKNLRRRLRDLDAAPAAVPPDLRQARAAQRKALLRLLRYQASVFQFDRENELRARRNLAFARTDYVVSRRYADDLSLRADQRQADAAQDEAQRAEAQLTALRKALAPLLQTAATNLGAAATQADAALQAVGEARSAHQEEQARAAYASAQRRRTQSEAQNDCWKEFISLQKAGAAFAREQADRARNLAANLSNRDVNEEERQLRDSLTTSEQYVRSFGQLLQKLDDQIDASRRELNLPPERLQDAETQLGALFGSFRATHPPAPDLVADLLRSLTGAWSEGGGKADVASALVDRLAQRQMLRVRKTIAENWLVSTREHIGRLERRAGQMLWRQHDPRLNATTFAETGALLEDLAASARAAWPSWMADLPLPEAPSRHVMLRALILIALAALLAWTLTRYAVRRLANPWLATRFAAMLPLACAAGLLLRVCDGSLVLRWLGGLLLCMTFWLGIRTLLLAPLPNHTRPPRDHLGGGLLSAFDSLAAWTVLVLPVAMVAAAGTNAWDLMAVLQRIWLFGACLAAFRLLLHPTLAGRLLSRRSHHVGLRWLGTATAVVCVVVAALAALPFLAGLNNLGSTVLHTVEATFSALAVAVAGTWLLAFGLRRAAAGRALGRLVLRAGQAGVLLMAATSVGLIWWRLTNRVLLASNAPQPVQDMVRVSARVLHGGEAFWHAKLSAGMTVSSLTRGLVVFVLSFWVARELKRLFQTRVLARTPMDEATRLTFATILGYLVVLLGFLVGLNVAGSSLQNLALLAGAITVGIGFGLQNVINNFVSSLMIHFSRTIRVGDYIDVGGTKGTVQEIGLRSTRIVTDDDITVLIPNGSFISANIVNWTNPSRRTRLHVPAAVTRQADLGAVAEIASQVARQHPLVVQRPPPTVEVRAVTAAQVSLDLLIWSDKPERLASIVGEVSLALDKELRAKGYAV